MDVNKALRAYGFRGVCLAVLRHSKGYKIYFESSKINNKLDLVWAVTETRILSMLPKRI